jgi:hypothetical protein
MITPIEIKLVSGPVTPLRRSFVSVCEAVNRKCTERRRATPSKPVNVKEGKRYRIGEAGADAVMAPKDRGRDRSRPAEEST